MTIAFLEQLIIQSIRLQINTSVAFDGLSATDDPTILEERRQIARHLDNAAARLGMAIDSLAAARASEEVTEH
jgi:histidine ammonia-lyase